MKNKTEKEGYAYLYREGETYLHVGPLGAGVQGTCSLVWNKQLYVRKAACYQKEHYSEVDEYGPEVNHYSEHANINKLIAFQHHAPIREIDLLGPKGLIEGEDMTHDTLIHSFCNGGDLNNFYKSWAQKDLMIPEGLIWRFAWQMLNALNHLHREENPAVSHGDLHAANILVNWPPGKKSRPNFFLADLGLSWIHDLETLPNAKPGQMIHDMEAADGFAMDMRDLGALIVFLMTGDRQDPRCIEYCNERICDEYYSIDLLAVADTLCEHADDVQDDINANNDSLREFVRKKANARRPVFDTYEELTSQVTRPPGPIDIVKIDKKTFKVLQIISGPHCSDTVHYGTQTGVPVKINGQPFGASSDVEMGY